MDDEIKEALFFVFSYAPDISAWVVLKKEMLKMLPSEKRKIFSTRDSKTKKHSVNEAEKFIILKWKEITGKDLYLEHDEKS